MIDSPEIERAQYFDPFAEEGEQYFDPIGAFTAIQDAYLNDEIEHDYSADRFVRDTEVLMLDAMFLGRYEEAQMIALSIHNCQDHAGNLASALGNSAVIGGLMEQHNEDDGHDHSSHDHSTEHEAEKENHESGCAAKNDSKAKCSCRD